jgi:hypothetical protein
VHIRCPTCGKQDEVDEGFQWRPFCSRRCKIIDLGNWLDEVYRFSTPVGRAEGEPQRVVDD